MEINRKQILESFLENIEGISNKEYQKRVWIRGEGPEVDDFTETTCHFFEEGEGILEEYKGFNITNKQYKLLVRFRDRFDKFVKEFIDTPEWAKIMDMAKNVLKAFIYSKK